MKKSLIKKIIILFSFILSALNFSCKSELKEENQKTKLERLTKEFELLTNEAELNSLLTRSSEGIVDWELAREIAQLQLDSFIEDGDYPETSELWNIPIAVYNDKGVIRFYEFRVVDNFDVIAAITINAQESLGGPIAYVFSMKGYMDNLIELYNKGLLSENEIPRVVDNVYPSYVIAISEVTKSGDIKFDTLINPTSCEEVKSVDKLLTVEEFINRNPEVFTEEEVELKFEEISNYSEEMTEFWKTAKENKGNMGNLFFRGGSKKVRTEIDASMIKKSREDSARIVKDYLNMNIPIGYGPCGATVSGFVLDYLDSNFECAPEWKKINNKNARVTALKNALCIVENSNITWPWNLSGAISRYSNYKVVLSGFWPKESINNNIPGISLRALDFSSWDNLTGGFHYRNVIAYKEEGWAIFKWKYIKILDGNNADQGWEAYNPFWHVSSYNVVKK